MIGTILQQWTTQSSRSRAVLCSIIQWKGSVPRKDYPMMLVLENGSILGTIGGGSMELEIIQAAVELMDKSGSHIFDFDMTGNDVHADIGLCGGTLKVLVEPFTKELKQFYENMLDQMNNNRKLMVKLSIFVDEAVHVKRALIFARRNIQESDSKLQAQLQRNFENQKTESFEKGNEYYLMWQPFTPPLIHIFGAGHVGQSVAELAHFSDLQVKVYDDRLELLTSARFPYAQMVEIGFPINREAVFDIPRHDFVIIASREHKHDRELLAGILRTPPKYIGLVSSARKWKILSESLISDGADPESVSRVHAPVGLNIEAQTVPEIAISIVSEIIAEYREALD